jgi:hypothetical protein
VTALGWTIGELTPSLRGSGCNMAAAVNSCADTFPSWSTYTGQNSRHIKHPVSLQGKRVASRGCRKSTEGNGLSRCPGTAGLHPPGKPPWPIQSSAHCTNGMPGWYQQSGPKFRQFITELRQLNPARTWPPAVGWKISSLECPARSTVNSNLGPVSASL